MSHCTKPSIAKTSKANSLQIKKPVVMKKDLIAIAHQIMNGYQGLVDNNLIYILCSFNK